VTRDNTIPFDGHRLQIPPGPQRHPRVAPDLPACPRETRGPHQPPSTPPRPHAPAQVSRSRGGRRSPLRGGASGGYSHTPPKYL
jgi:hypothetical protein